MNRRRREEAGVVQRTREGRHRRLIRAGRTSKEDPVHDGILARQLRDFDPDAAGQPPDDVLPVMEPAHRVRGEQLAVDRVKHLEQLDTRRAVPIERVERDIMGLAVRQVDREPERVAEPRGRESSRAAPRRSARTSEVDAAHVKLLAPVTENWHTSEG